MKPLFGPSVMEGNWFKGREERKLGIKPEMELVVPETRSSGEKKEK